MDVNSADWSQREFRELSGVCDFKEGQMCSKTKYACRDLMCPIVRAAADIKEVRANFVQEVAPFLESQKPSTNTESMPCLVGINGQQCRLGWPCKCQAPACLIARTAYVS